MSLAPQINSVTPASPLRSFIFGVNDVIRIIGMQLVLVPAACLLPQQLALTAADAVSLLLVCLPVPGWITYARMRKAFGGTPIWSFRLTWAAIARPFRDFVILKRILHGRESVTDWKIVERNADRIAALRASGESFIVVAAHFQRVAVIALACARITPGNLVVVGNAPPEKVGSLLDLKLRLQYGTMLKVLATAWRRPFEFAFNTRGHSAAGLIYQRLREPGNTVLVHVDAPWEKRTPGSFTRAFAGVKERLFPTGVAQLAALTHCPIVSCTYWQEPDGTIVLDWGTPIRQVDDEIETMNRLLDPLEVAIGERPTQYVLKIGGERRWNATRKHWEI